MAVHSNASSVALRYSVLEGCVSGYDAWRKREPGRHRREEAFLAEKIVEAFQHKRRFPRLFYATPSLTTFSALFTWAYLVVHPVGKSQIFRQMTVKADGLVVRC